VFKLALLIIVVLALGSRLVPALSWVLAFFILLMLADLVRSELRRRFGRHESA
jgi:hypothetical protein